MERAPLDDDTRRAYTSRVRSFLAWLVAPKPLDAREQKCFLRAVEVRRLARDRAIGRLLFYSELVALDGQFRWPRGQRKSTSFTKRGCRLQRRVDARENIRRVM